MTAYNRRQFLRHAALVTASGAIAALASACGGAVGTAPAGSAAGATQAASGTTTKPSAVQAGGTLTWALWDAIDSIDPATASGASALEIIHNIIEPLVMIDENEKIYPYLATKWTMDDGGKRFTFTLRDGVTFHDGTPLEAIAVKRSWERILDPATKAAGVADLYGPVEAITAPDAKTVVVTYKVPYPTLPLQAWRPYFGILSPKYLDTLKPGEKITAPIGTGPFKFAGKSADGVVTLEAFKEYAWGPEQEANRKAPYLQAIKYRSIIEGATRVATLESGENLLIDEIPEADYGRLKGDKRFRFVDAPNKGHTVGFYFNVTKAPTDDRTVREAINWAVDRQAIVQKLFFGVHRVSVGPLSAGVWGRLEELEKRYTFDQKKAQQVLDEAGWKAGPDGIRAKDGQKLSLVLATFRDPWSQIAEAVQGQLRPVGIDLQVQKMERGAYLDFVRAYKHNMCASSTTSLDPDGVLRLVYESSAKGKGNFSGLNDPQLDDLLRKGAQQEIGDPARRKTYEDAQRRIMESMPYVGVMTQLRVKAMAAKVRNLPMGPDGLNTGLLNDLGFSG